MNKTAFYTLDLDIARARIVLSLLAMVSLYVDPSTAGGLFHLTPYAFATLFCHLAYSGIMHFAYKRGLAEKALPRIAVAGDLFFASAIAFLTEGQTSPSYIFFVFAIIAVGMRSGLRATLQVTFGGVVLYLSMVALSDGLSGIYFMRTVYLAIAGYLVGFFGQQRASYEERVRELETQASRQAIARSLHDSFVQSLAGVNLRLESCRELIRCERPHDAADELRELQKGVEREYDEVRGFIRSLAGVDSAVSSETFAKSVDPRVHIKVALSVGSWTAERVLQIMLEGLRNSRKHSRANVVEITASLSGDAVAITINDDGIGFPSVDSPPWVIASHVAESGGRLSIGGAGLTRLEVEIPNIREGF